MEWEGDVTDNIFFLNIAGAYWALFSHNSQLLNAVIKDSVYLPVVA